MKKAHIILIDDQIDVLATLMQDLTTFRERFILDDCESVKEAYELLEELEASGEQIALIMASVLDNPHDLGFHKKAFREVRKLASQFPLFSKEWEFEQELHMQFANG